MLSRSWVSDSPSLTVRVWHEPVEQFYWWDISCSVYRLHSRIAASTWSPPYPGKLHFLLELLFTFVGYVSSHPKQTESRETFAETQGSAEYEWSPHPFHTVDAPFLLCPMQCPVLKESKHKTEWIHKVGISHQWDSVPIVFQTFALKQ